MRLDRAFLFIWTRPWLFSTGCQHRNPRALPSATRPVTPARLGLPGARYSSSFSDALAASIASETQALQSLQHAEDLISSLPLTRYIRSVSSSNRSTGATYMEFRPMRTMHPAAQSTHLVTTSLISPSKLPIDPIFFLKHSSATCQPAAQDKDKVEIIATAYLSTHLTGHAGYIHGGLLGVLFDDAFARLAAEIFSSRTGMTANLTLDFRAPAMTGRVYVYRVEIERVEKERKVWVRGSMRCLKEFGVQEMLKRSVESANEVDDGGLSVEERDGVLVAEARGLFVEPKGAKEMVPLYPK
ncbi:HotDog domain-containing protein [Aspergillus multicolor]|uniref:PaaI family thioesterase n=1 Tax=Aspergillus multicolor TaxID=41759 RepID=UPI003CCDA91A